MGWKSCIFHDRALWGVFVAWVASLRRRWIGEFSALLVGAPCSPRYASQTTLHSFQLFCASIVSPVGVQRRLRIGAVYNGPNRNLVDPTGVANNWFAMGPRMMNTHIFMIWELISQLHRTSFAQGFLAGNSFVHFGRLHKLLAVNAPFTHTDELSGKQLSNCTHICYRKEEFPKHLCNHFGPHRTGVLSACWFRA